MCLFEAKSFYSFEQFKIAVFCFASVSLNGAKNGRLRVSFSLDRLNSFLKYILPK